MRQASSAFARTVIEPHVIVTRCDVLFNREPIVEGLAVAAGNVEYDRTAERLARLSITLAEPAAVPGTAGDILTPYGYELRVWRGVRVQTRTAVLSTAGVPMIEEDGTPMIEEDGTPMIEEQGETTVVEYTTTAVDELVPLGVFPIQSSDVARIGLAATIAAEDRSRLVSDARFEDDYVVPRFTNYATAIETLISAGVSGLVFNLPSTTFLTPRLVFAAQSDRWTAAQQMAKSIGMELYFDGLGELTMRPEPTFADPVVATIAEGVNLVDANLSLDRSTAYNRVIATSRNASTGATFRGVATDDDPASPTYYFGPFGRKPRFFYSEFIASDEQAASAARAVLAANLGVSKSIGWVSLPDPRLECSDVVLVSDSAFGIAAPHIIDTLRIGLTANDPTSGTSRTRQAAQ